VGWGGLGYEIIEIEQGFEFGEAIHELAELAVGNHVAVISAIISKKACVAEFSWLDYYTDR
jgi:hypothetical protein